MPSHQEKLAFIRAAAIAANPEIVELKFGCVVKTPPMGISAPENDASYFKLIEKDLKGKWKVVERYGHLSESSITEIIGRPITLCDVIQTIKKAGYNSTDEWHKTLGHLVDYWSINHDKGDDLNVKSEGTIDFIHTVLK